MKQFMKQIKAGICFLVMFALLISALPTLVVQAETPAGASTAKATANSGLAAQTALDPARIGVANVTCKPGETVIVPITMGGNQGIAAMRLEFGYDSSVLKLERTVTGSALSGLCFIAPVEKANRFSASWLTLSGNNDTSIGVIRSLVFSVPADAKDGTYPIIVTYDTVNTIDYTGKKLDYDISNGSVTVQHETIATVNVKGAVMSYNAQIPTSVQLLQNGAEVRKAEMATPTGYVQIKQDFTIKNVTPGAYTLVITKNLHTKFTVNNFIVEDKDLDLTKDKHDDLKCIMLYCGDLNGDGIIDAADLNTVWSSKNYGRRISDAETPYCDLNGDGIIDAKDLNIIWSSENYGKRNVIFEYSR